jgi:nucleoside-diphosphate-sugar epimerase
MTLSKEKKTKILVTGACGQLGTELVGALREKYGKAQVIATDIFDRGKVLVEAPYYSLDVLNSAGLEWLVHNLGVTEIWHLAAVLSASGEKEPLRGWDLNMRGLLNVLEAGRKFRLSRIFWPSSIAVFGPGSPRAACPQAALTDPSTAYGISKVAGEYWCKYYRLQYGLDVRSLRYPGLISYSAKAGGGTTDYAVDIFYQALACRFYECYLRPDTGLPMLYMPDAVRGTLELMAAPLELLTVLTAYNLSGLSFTPRQLVLEIARHVPDFRVDYVPDRRQEIADSWPVSIDDRHARNDWGWKPEYDLNAMVADMLKHLKVRELGGAV